MKSHMSPSVDIIPTAPATLFPGSNPLFHKSKGIRSRKVKQCDLVEGSTQSAAEIKVEYGVYMYANILCMCICKPIMSCVCSSVHVHSHHYFSPDDYS